MNKNKRNKRDMIDDKAFIKAITRFRSGDQYLEGKNKVMMIEAFNHTVNILFYESKILCNTYLVTLKTRRSLRALNPERPKALARGLKWTQKTSKTDPVITTVSNLLNADPKYLCGPRAYNRTNISNMNVPRKNISA